MNNHNGHQTERGRLRVCHVISSLRRGGAQAMIHKLIESTQNRIDTSRVVSLVEDGTVAEELRELGVPVTSLDMTSTLSVFPALRSLRSIFLRDQPDVIQTWMYHADLLGGLAARMAGRVPVVWNIRHGDLRTDVDSLTTRFVSKLCAQCSGWLPARIIVNSQCGRQSHQRIGYDGARMQYIPNAFDTETFAPAGDARRFLLQHWQLDPSARIVAILGRYHPMKGHRHFLRAMRGICRHNPNVRLLLVGTDMDRNNGELAALIEETGLASRCLLWGERDNVPDWLAGVDLLVSASICGEGFSNVLGEAMACGVSCVATDVGDARIILGNFGGIVEPGHEHALAAACLAALRRPPGSREQLASQAKQFIADRHSVPAIAKQYTQVWWAAAGGATEKSPRRPGGNERRDIFNRDAA